jgi:chemotaxis protein histidine kinase CheA
MKSGMSTAEDILSPDKGSIMFTDYMSDFREDVEQILNEAERILVKVESRSADGGDFKRFTYLVNKLKGASYVIGVRWVSDVATMLDDISVKLKDIDDGTLLTTIVDTIFSGFDGVRRHIDNLIRGVYKEDNALLLKVKNFHEQLHAHRTRLNQSEIDMMFN